MRRHFLRSIRKARQTRLRSLSRRKLLQLGLAAGAGLLSTSNSPRAALAASNSMPRVIVIGAGFAGLACAYELASVGYDVQVLEARRRVGGRVLSLKNLIPGKNVEGGGELLGSNHPHVMAYAAKFGFSFLDVLVELAPSPIVLGGRKLRESEILEVEEECENAYALMTKEAIQVNADEPWKTARADELDEQTTADWIASLNLSGLANRLLTLQFTSDNGVSVQQQSLLGNLSQVKGGGLDNFWTDTELFRLKGGNQQFALRMATELGDSKIKLGCAVREIEVGESHVVARDESGERYEADDIVLAIPPSTWSKIQFTPQFPEQLAPQMGANLKFLSVLSEPVWHQSNQAPDSFTDADINATWHGTDGQNENGPVALIAFSGGPAAERIHQRAVPERQPEYIKSLETLYPGYTQHFLRGQLMDWMADPWTLAGYSFPSPGQVTTIGPILRQGLGRLHFAGEHCCYQFVGYMEGALYSGASLAKRLAIRDGHLR